MTQSFQQLLVTNYGLLPSGYTGSQGIQGVPGTSDSTPKITAIAVTDSSYTVLDDTAVDIAGGYVQLTGTGFASGCVVMINNVPATSTTFVGSTQVRAQLPATAAGTYVVYLVNTDGGVAIRINGITFSATPAWTTASALPETSDGTAISIQLAAEGADTYALAAGSTLPGTVTLTSGGLLSGVVSGLENETTYSFTVVATDAELQDSPRTFSITITAGDLLFAATTLLLPGAATTFVQDASTNNFAVTVAGDTRPNTFNPYLTGWSNYFDGSGDSIQVGSSNTGVTFGTADFTIEAWVYWNSLSSESAIMVGNGVGWTFYVYPANKLQWGTTSPQSAANLLTGNTTLNTGTWYHIAVTRASGTVTLWVNGVSDGTVADSANYSASGDLRVGISHSGQFFNGYMSNVRVVKGTAVYTANFTPSTTPLEAIADTSLLTCQSNRFVDASTNNFAVTRTGDVAVRSFSPFAEPATTNGSGYFDGTGDYLSVASAAGNALGAGDFTIQLWFFLSGTTGVGTQYGEIGLVGCGNVTSSRYTIRCQGTGPRVMSWWLNTPSNNVAGSTAIALNTWYHVALVRNGSGTNNVKLYLNGVLESQGTSTYNSPADNISIGRGYPNLDSEYTNGYISNLQMVVGTALYTANFTPPTQPLTAIANTSLLTLQNNQPANNSQFLDSGSNNFPITRAGNTTQGTFSPYSPAGWSNYFDGNNDYLAPATGAAFTMGTGDFTYECWVNRSGVNPINSSYVLTVFDTRTAEPSIAPCLFWETDAMKYYVNGANRIASTSTFPIGDWVHVAIVRSSGITKMYVNGVQEGSSYTDTNNYVGTTTRIGGRFAAVSSDFRSWFGYISNARIVKGTAVYTAAFTPSTTPLTAIAGTSLLTCQSPQFVDNSPNRFAVTRAGDVRVQNFAPFRAVTQTPVSYSAYFDGNSDSLLATIPAIGTGDFTFEAWVYRTSTSSDENVIVNGSGNSQGWGMAIDGQKLRARVHTTNLLFSTSNIPTGAWTHCAISKQGTTVRLFVNGILERTGTSTYNATATALIIGNWAAGGSSYEFTGHISNVRVVTGTAVYTTDFALPAQPLTAVANTSLLTCQSATFVDNSTNRLAITVAGNAQPTTVNPFGSTFTNSNGYTAAEYSGSMYFDGTGDYLTMPTASGLQFGTGDFTIEAWVYLTSLANFNGVFDSRTLGGTGVAVTIFANGTIECGSGGAYITGGTFVTNMWNHVAFARSSNTGRVFLNGVQVASAAHSVNYTATDALIGKTTDNWYCFGYISDVRVIKGQALYTSNFVPPLAPVQPVQNTTLLLNGTAAAITDATTRNVLETVGDAKISTVQSKFGGSSMYFDGTGDYLTIPKGPMTDFGSADFTVEMWYYISSVSALNPLIGKGPSDSDDEFFLAIVSGGGYYFDYGDYMLGGTAITNAWTHLALVRNGTSIKLYANGTLVVSGTLSGAITNNYNMYIGMARNGTFHLNGYIQDLRITQGHARYTANFTPPTAAFQTR